MNSLEFINLEIAITNSKYKEHIKFGQTAFAVKDEKRLQTLQQIKSELEAWYVVKNNTMGNNYLYEITIYKSEKEDYEKFKKALEVKENDS